MGIPMAAMMGAGALMGGIGGKQQAKAASQPVKSWTDPWKKGAAGNLFDNYTNAMNNAAGLDWGPTADQTALYNRMMQTAMGKGGGGGGGGGGFQSIYGGKGKGGGG